MALQKRGRVGAGGGAEGGEHGGGRAGRPGLRHPVRQSGAGHGGVGRCAGRRNRGTAGAGAGAFPAALAGAYLHGLAGDLAAREIGPVGMVAGDLTPRLPRAIRSLALRRSASLAASRLSRRPA